jgi:hypothetical protein
MAAFRFIEITDRIAAIGWVESDYLVRDDDHHSLGIGFVASILFFIPILGWFLIILNGVSLPFISIYSRALGLLFVLF